MSKIKLLLDVVEDMRALAASIESLAKATSEPEHVLEASPAAPHEPETPQPPDPTSATLPPLTIVELRAIVAERSTPENRVKIKAILGTFGVNKLTELPVDKYDALLREVMAL